MKEPLRLMTVERDVSRIQVEHDLAGRIAVRLDEQIAQQRVDLLRRVTTNPLARFFVLSMNSAIYRRNFSVHLCPELDSMVIT